MVALSVGISTVWTTLIAQFLHIDLRNDGLWVKAEALALSQNVSVLADEGITAIHHVLCAFAKATATVDIPRYRTGALLREQLFQIAMLSYKVVACREIEYQFCSRKGEFVARRIWRPYIFAYFHAESYTIVCTEYFMACR